MIPSLPAILPTFLRRRSTAQPWPGNPRLVVQDLRESLDHEAELADQLTKARRDADELAARAAAFERRAVQAETAHQQAAADLVLARAEVKHLRSDRDGLRRQLDSAMYDDTVLAAIESGTGQPIKSR